MCAPVEKGASCVSESRYRREARREKGRFEKVESRGRGENAREVERKDWMVVVVVVGVRQAGGG
jgi:hypothetical protein